MYKVLVVDDVVDNTILLSHDLEDQGYEVLTASSGRECIDFARRYRPDVVLLDVMMPDMDGLETCNYLKSNDLTKDIPIIMLSAADEDDMISACFDAGAQDYIVKPYSFMQLSSRLRAAVRMKVAYDMVHKLNRRMERDLDLAAKVQQSLLPQSADNIDEVECGWAMEPCEALGGDLVNLFKIDDEHFAFYVLDVSGHGVGASLLSVQVSRMLTANRGGGSLVATATQEAPYYRVASPTEVLVELNRMFPMEAPSNQFFTMFYGILHIPSGKVSYACAGHPPPIWIKADGSVQELVCQGTAVGVMNEEYFKVNEYELQLDKGDRLYAVSDGLIEAMNSAKELFGEDRLVDCIKRFGDQDINQVISCVYQAVNEWTAPQQPKDDCSIVGIGW